MIICRYIIHISPNISWHMKYKRKIWFICYIQIRPQMWINIKKNQIWRYKSQKKNNRHDWNVTKHFFSFVKKRFVDERIFNYYFNISQLLLVPEFAHWCAKISNFCWCANSHTGVRKKKLWPSTWISRRETEKLGPRGGSIKCPIYDQKHVFQGVKRKNRVRVRGA